MGVLTAGEKLVIVGLSPTAKVAPVTLKKLKSSTTATERPEPGVGDTPS